MNTLKLPRACRLVDPTRPRAAIEATPPVRPEADTSGVSSSAMPKYQQGSNFPSLFT